MFSLMQAFVAPFVMSFGGEFWHDTMEMVIPPTDTPIDISYVPDPYTKSLVIGVTFGRPREYDPYTGTIGPEILGTGVGLYHSTKGYMAWHWDPFVESIINTNPYPQLLWTSKDRPYLMRIVNNTGKYVWCDATFWLIRFPRRIPCPLYGECDPEELFKKYMQGVTSLMIALSGIGAEELIRILSKPPVLEVRR